MFIALQPVVMVSAINKTLTTTASNHNHGQESPIDQRGPDQRCSVCGNTFNRCWCNVGGK